MPEPAPRNRRHAPPEMRRAQILAAALDCFSRKGYHAATMDDLVEASGLSKGSLYWHFRSKQDVFLALFEHLAEQVFADWEAAGDGPTVEVVRRVGERSLERIGQGGALLRAWGEFFSHPEARRRLAEIWRRSRAMLAASLERDVARGRVRDLPVAGMAAALTAALEGLVLQGMVDSEFDVHAHWDTVWEVVTRGFLR